MPEVLATALRKAGRAVPAPVKGYMLVDTGASTTCISEEAAQQLGLRPISIEKGYGAGGVTSHNVYEAGIQVVIGAGNGQQNGVSSDRRVKGIPEMSKHQLGIEGPNGEQITLVGLLGRDFLSLGTLTYHGHRGSFDFTIKDGAPHLEVPSGAEPAPASISGSALPAPAPTAKAAPGPTPPGAAPSTSVQLEKSAPQ